jgi:UPF0755 protein
MRLLKRFVPLFVLLIGLALLAWYWVNRAATDFSEDSRFFYIHSDSATYPEVLRKLESQSILRSTRVFRFLAGRNDYANHVHPGKYRINRGMSEWDVYRLLRSGRQEPVKLVINKFRTQEEFARFAGRQLECDSADITRYLRDADSMRVFGLDSFTAMTLVIPDTYQVFWNTSASSLIRRLNREREKFWTDERRGKAQALGLTPEQAYTLASIVEEETNKHDEKPRIASVYLNRLSRGMPLGADPTIKYALRDFGLKRILFRHIDASASSPYNTYRNKGLPPGPICTPSRKSIDAVLQAEKTDYLFFCARPNFSGYHAFAADDKEHMRNAKAYQAFLDSIRVK